MDMTLLIVESMLVLAMAIVSAYGARSLPAGTPVPIHFGGGYNNWVPKPLGLTIWPVVGIAISVLLNVIARSAEGSVLEVVCPVVLAVFLVVQFGAIKAARSRSGQ